MSLFLFLLSVLLLLPVLLVLVIVFSRIIKIQLNLCVKFFAFDAVFFFTSCFGKRCNRNRFMIQYDISRHYNYRIGFSIDVVV